MKEKNKKEKNKRGLIVATTLLVGLMFLLSACDQEGVDYANLPKGTYVSCEQVKEPICSIDKDTVCAKIKIVGKLTDTIEWEEFFNGCKACQASSREKRVIGFEKGECGLSRDEMNPKKESSKEDSKKENSEDTTKSNEYSNRYKKENSVLDIPEIGKVRAEAIKNSECVTKPSNELSEECNKRNGVLAPNKISRDCIINYHCKVER